LSIKNKLREYIIGIALVLLLTVGISTIIFCINPFCGYGGFIIILTTLFLGMDFYHRSSTKQLYEDMINKFHELINTILEILKK
jgi:hypothetical protein